MSGATAKLSSKAQAVIPLAVRKRLGVGPGDTVTFRETPLGMVVEKLELPVGEDGGDPFAEFIEWSDPREDEAWRDLSR